MQSARSNGPSKGRVITLWALGLATIAGFVIFGAIDRKMYAAGGPGIIRFEMVGDRITAARILSAWGVDGRDAAALSLWLDFGFLAIYGAFLVLAIKTLAVAMARRGREHLAWLGGWIWWFAVAGAAFDVLEDVALLTILHGNTGHLAPRLATHFAVLKFAMLTSAVLYVIAATFIVLRDRSPSERAKRSSPQQ